MVQPSSHVGLHQVNQAFCFGLVSLTLPLNEGSCYFQQAELPLPDRSQTYKLLHLLGIDEVLTPKFFGQVDVHAAEQQQRDVWAAARTDDRLNRQLAFDWRYTVAENDLPKVCGITQLSELTVGFAVLGAWLVNFWLRLRTATGLKLRSFFNEALRGFLPLQIITKNKQGFGLPFGVWPTQQRA